MQAKWQGQAIAESDEYTRLAGYVYFPRPSVRMDLLAGSPKTARDLECPHGVQFYDLVQSGSRASGPPGPYEAPQAAHAAR